MEDKKEPERPPLRTNPLQGWDDATNNYNLQWIEDEKAKADPEREKEDLKKLKKDIRLFAEKQGLESFPFSCPHV